MKELFHCGLESEFRFIEFAPSQPLAGDKALIYLHGSGERGDDLPLIKRYGLPALLSQGSAITNCAVICPQLDVGQEWQPQRLLKFMEALKATYPHVALVGFSLGGTAVCEVVAEYGAAIVRLAVAIAGRSNRAAVAPQGGGTFLSIQGELDPRPSMKDFVQSVNILGGTAYEVTLPDQDHYISEQALWHPVFQSLLKTAGFSIEPIQTARY